jgi:DNA-binding transcriptional LysR family regulator
MQQHLHRGAASMHRKDTLNASWEDLHAFLLCTRHQSFRNAAEVLGLTGTTLMRKIDRLEEELGFKLFLRDQSGLSLSDEGRALLFDVEQMERLSFNIFRRVSMSTEINGSVRVAVTEGPGNSWVLPRLIDFQKTYRKIMVDLRCAMEQADVSRLEADISIQLARRRIRTSLLRSSEGFTFIRLRPKHTAMPMGCQNPSPNSGITGSSSNMACNSTRPAMHEF